MILRSLHVLRDTGSGPAALHIKDGRIERISDYDDVDGGGNVADYGELTIMAGLVDSHVHVNEPGRTEWEGFETATRAAAAGGVTTIVDMPLNSLPPVTTVEAVRAKVAALRAKCRVDVALWGGAVPGNAASFAAMLDEGVVGFKCFLVDSGVPEFGHLDADGLSVAMSALATLHAPLIVHAELPGPIDAARKSLFGDVSSYRRYLASRPPAAEDEAIALVAEVARRSGARAHIVHLSSARALEIIAEAENVTAETTPHYLFFDAETIPEGATEFKCAPPIREHANRERLWRGLDELVAIVSDHSPCLPELKRAPDIEHAWGGIASLQFALPIVWTEAKRRGVPLAEIARRMTRGPAELAGLDARKGRLAPGYDADVVVWDPDAVFVVTPGIVEHRHKVTPYLGRTLHGVVKTTYLRGRKVWEDGRAIGDPVGEWIRR
ncbi:MAG TPA: allantoinase AllB [Thermoanaerobaculia bacterium]